MMRVPISLTASSLLTLLLAMNLACASEPEIDVQVAEAGQQQGRLADFESPIEGGLPQGHPPVGEETPMASFPPEPGRVPGAAALLWTVPEGWSSLPPSSSLRRAQYRVPGEAGDGECLVFYFGPGQGGDPVSNARRWAAQFAQPDGSSPFGAMRTESIEVGGIPVILVEVSGTYQNSPMMGGPPEPMPGYMLLGAIAAGTDANWFFKLTGPEATVRDQKAAFHQMIDSLRRAEG